MYSWMTGEGFWMLGMVGGGLEKKIDCMGISGQKLGYVFAVEDIGCGEGEGWGSGVLGR